MKQTNPSYEKYKTIDVFKKFKIENGNIVWGKNWDLIFKIDKLYKNTISVGRKSVSDKVVLVRLYVKESVIEKNGGIEAINDKCHSLLNS
jgi:hypothetical protein